MANQLLTISRIFSEKIFRIPDYQRGYAWEEKQLRDFWNDIVQLEDGSNHYVGVITLEAVHSSKWKEWDDDRWIIESKSYEPYYVVDGQQRLTTTLILIQAITECVRETQELNYTPVTKIKEKFIFETKNKGISRSYIFGYEKDNPSYEFLKRRIFLENGEGYRDEETIYTQNLENAKVFFIESLKRLKKIEIEAIYKKITQNLLFNMYYISNDIDVFVAFETMNNRGKPLSNLELLKNRLIYLSTKFDVDISEKSKLRRRINDSWKAIYHYLGKNKDKPLNDDTFLINHFILAFGKELERKDGDKTILPKFQNVYSTFLLEEKFTLKNIKSSASTQKLTVEDIDRYINSLQEAVKAWYNLHNPTEFKYFDDEEKYWLDKLYRLNEDEFGALTLSVYLKSNTKKQRIKYLQLIETYIFLTRLSYRYWDELSFAELAIKVHTARGAKIDFLFNELESKIARFQNSKEFMDSVIARFRSINWYKWKTLRYFLYEYELSLKEKSKTNRDKINWAQYNREYDEFITVEHIYPQKANETEWSSLYKLHYSYRSKLNNSLGNLLPLSRPKNASLQNAPFAKKVDNGTNKSGYRYGSYSENEITKFSEWLPQNILDRGIQLLTFMEKRWGINFGNDSRKIEALALSFLIKK